MKPYASRGTDKDDVGCCPGHDWPRTYRWSGRYRSRNSKRTDKKCNVRAKRIRRHVDKAKLRETDE